ncbi:MAG: SDR family oxidoreductase [Ktedonobacteraceae bacterium]
MATGFIGRNWKILAALAGFAVVRELIQRRKFIELQGKVVLITGGSRGFGLAMAEEFATEGTKLVICAREGDELERAQAKLREFGTDVLTVQCDVTKPEEVQQLMTQATAHFGQVDILVNNAGIISAGPWHTLTRGDFEESMNIIFWGTYNTTMAVLPQMRARGTGRIVNIASVGGKVSVPHLLSYASAKFAVVGLSEGLHAELAQEGIDVITVAPGLMRTGSQVNAIVKGDKHKEEYALFALIDTLPGSSISVARAAKQVVRATKRGDTELIISVPAQILARLYGAFPGMITDILTLSTRFLPKGEGTARHLGRESETPISQSFLTILGQKASQEYNEL